VFAKDLEKGSILAGTIRYGYIDLLTFKPSDFNLSDNTFKLLKHYQSSTNRLPTRLVVETITWEGSIKAFNDRSALWIRRRQK